ncbi:MAG TPA: DUF1707 domain-containing protein [Nocardioidaceae bacterium]|nr:DUF1707 domain-containing protein [Nocardioidaceae bacterium]
MNRPEPRIGDAERDAAVSALSEHYVAGRLTKDEYDERSEVAWKARTNSDLAPLFLDLPPLPQARRAPVPAVPAARPHPGHQQRGGGTRFPLLPLIAILVGLAMLTDEWVVLVLVGVLWWAGVFRWLHNVTSQQRRRR